MKTRTFIQTRRVFQTEHGGYLRYVGGGWGPTYSTTEKWEEATRFELNEDPSQEWGASLRPRLVVATVTETMK